MKLNRIILIAFSFILLSANIGRSQTAWDVPADKKSVKNPLAADKSAVEKGKGIYMKNCKSCHGEPGKDNGLKLNPPPIDPLSDKYQANTEGENFFKITTGRAAMPTFEKTLPENDRWAVISYVKSLRESGVKTNAVNADITLKLDTTNKTILAMVTAKNEKGETVPVENAEIGFFVKRYFGNLPLSDKKIRTNASGYAAVNFPKDILGDTVGNVQLIVKMIDEKHFGKNTQEQQLKWGVPHTPVNLLKDRAMWGNRAHTPIWLLLTYLSVVLTIWGFIVYIILQIRGLRKAGRKQQA